MLRLSWLFVVLLAGQCASRPFPIQRYTAHTDLDNFIFLLYGAAGGPAGGLAGEIFLGTIAYFHLIVHVMRYQHRKL